MELNEKFLHLLLSALRFFLFSVILFFFYFGSCGWWKAGLTASFRAHVNIVSLLTYLLTRNGKGSVEHSGYASLISGSAQNRIFLLVRIPTTREIHRNSSTSFWVILRADRQTHKGKNMTSLAELFSEITTRRLANANWRASAVAAALYRRQPGRIWNTPPLHVSHRCLIVNFFKQHLKLQLFCFSFPELSPV